MEEKVLGFGVIGTGTYCDHYLRNLGPVYLNVRPVGCSDLNAEAAKAAAERWSIPKVYTTDEMMADPEVDIVLILTNPASHYNLTMQALKAGKHVYCEKPLATSLEQANEIVEFAERKGLFVGAAPDTFLSPEFQTVRKLIDEGAIGRVINVTANYVGPGADLWHPNAGFLYKQGGGPALDMGPYFLTTLVSLLGPLDSLFCYANRGWNVRRIWERDVDVEVMTNYCAVLKFENGTIGNINLTYDEWKSDLPGMELYGTDGVIIAPDPNTMMGPVRLLKADEFKAAVNAKELLPQKLEAIYGPETFGLFREIDTVAPRIGNERGAGLADMAKAIAEKRRPRVGADLCRHVTEAINAFNVSAETGLPYKMTTTFTAPEPMEW
ncbi:MAG: Gfo/Idh/MocA family oxidoreductase [Oscillospiraceae bacterium]|nr:Gfo/Idh/MocA family oxidoreductase [Oscillospiraceae bacterium]